MEEVRLQFFDAQANLDSEFNEAAASMTDFHNRYHEVVSAWEQEIRS